MRCKTPNSQGDCLSIVFHPWVSHQIWVNWEFSRYYLKIMGLDPSSFDTDMQLDGSGCNWRSHGSEWHRRSGKSMLVLGPCVLQAPSRYVDLWCFVQGLPNLLLSGFRPESRCCQHWEAQTRTPASTFQSGEEDWVKLTGKTIKNAEIRHKMPVILRGPAPRTYR